MRAILKISIASDRGWEDLRRALSDHDWVPNVPQDHPEVERARAGILADVYAEHSGLATETALLVIRDDLTDTWGMVNNAAGRLFAVRLKNSDPERLKEACEKLVADLQGSLTGQLRDRSEAFRFEPGIVVLAPQSNRTAFTGRIQGPKRFRIAVRDRRSEAYLGALFSLLAIALLLVTSPALLGPPVGLSPDPSYVWITGNLERLSTAVVVTAIVSWLQVFFRWFDIRRTPRVLWTA